MTDWGPRLEAFWKKHRPDVLEVLAPPATAIDVGVPPEVAAVFRWHDGQTDGGATSFVGTFFLMSLEEMEIQRRANAETSKDIGKPDWWRDTWYPFMDDGQGDLVCFDSATSDLVFYEHDNAERTRVAPSIGALFSVLATAFERDWFDPDEDYCAPREDSRTKWDELLEASHVVFPMV